MCWQRTCVNCKWQDGRCVLGVAVVRRDQKLAGVPVQREGRRREHVPPCIAMVVPRLCRDALPVSKRAPFFFQVSYQTRWPASPRSWALPSSRDNSYQRQWPTLSWNTSAFWTSTRSPSPLAAPESSAPLVRHRSLVLDAGHMTCLNLPFRVGRKGAALDANLCI